VMLRGQELVVGDIVLFWTTSDRNDAEIGWVFSPDFGGQGLATESVRVVIDFAIHDLGIRRIVAKVDSRNERSLALCRRLPLRHEATFVESRLFKGAWIDEEHFAVLDREWPRSGLI
jgi:RimJ/RimL family protein N-acetyltransferase